MAEAVHYPREQGILRRELMLIAAEDQSRVTHFGPARRLTAGSAIEGRGPTGQGLPAQ